MSSILPPLLVAIPLGAAFLIPIVARRLGRLADALGNLATFALLAIALLVFPARGVYQIGGWNPPIGISWVLDGLSNLMLVVVNLVSFAATLFSIPYMEQYTSKHNYYSLFLLMVAGMNGVALTGDLFNLFVFLEIASIASYALVAFGGKHEELEASFKYLVLGSIGSSLVLFGIAFVYAVTGYLNMAAISTAITGRQSSPVLILATVFFLVGFGLKAAVVPFHAWLPDAHPSAPAPISAMLSGVLIKALGVYVLSRVLFNVIGVTPLIGACSSPWACSPWSSASSWPWGSGTSSGCWPTTASARWATWCWGSGWAATSWPAEEPAAWPPWPCWGVFSIWSTIRCSSRFCSFARAPSSSRPAPGN